MLILRAAYTLLHSFAPPGYAERPSELMPSRVQAGSALAAMSLQGCSRVPFRMPLTPIASACSSTLA